MITKQALRQLRGKGLPVIGIYVAGSCMDYCWFNRNNTVWLLPAGKHQFTLN